MALYPAIEPYNSFNLDVGAGHSIYVEESGNPEGIPVVFLHGGPGGGITPSYRRYFDPDRWRVVLFDQRGAGKSKPHASLVENTTWHLVDDIEKIREKLAIDTWHVFGGSWGSTLALSYGISHPDRVRSFILRGIFMLRHSEIQWFYQHGASEIFPDVWETYESVVEPSKRPDMVEAYYEMLTSDDKELRMKAAKAWSVWEGSTSFLVPRAEHIEFTGEDHFAEALARIECHYFINNGFFDEDGWILKNISRVEHIPAYIAQGRYDVVCPVRSAWDLHKSWPGSVLEILDSSGHSASEEQIIEALIARTNSLAGK